MNKKYQITRLLYCFVVLALLQSCETEYQPDTSVTEQVYVVEGFIESGENAFPTYVMLTKSLPFYSTITSEIISESFERNAEITVSGGGQSVQLTRICTDELTPELVELLKQNFPISDAFQDFCVYLDVLGQIDANEGETYDLSILIDGENEITASTSIPFHLAIDTIYDAQAPGNDGDTIRELVVGLNDVADVEQFYRYQISINSRGFVSDDNSVFDDVFFDGKEFDFPLPRPAYADEDFDIDNFGLYDRGDTVDIRWTNVDKAHYNFWLSTEFESNNGGPFAGYTRATSNVNGALGIWGGYSVSYYNFVISK